MKVFISHSSFDKKFVRTLKDDLNENGIDTFVDEDSLEFGDSLEEKLEMALNDSSHFIIVLTNNASNSKWVEFELERAISLFRKKTLAKVIPIKYRDCIIPKEIAKLIYADLSKEIVQVDNEKVKFISSGYTNFLLALIKTLSASDKRLSLLDKEEIIKEAKVADKKIEIASKNQIFAKHKILNFKDSETTKKYIAIVSNTLKTHGAIKIYPILLPSMYKYNFNPIKKADKIKFIGKNNKSIIGYVAGFRSEQSHIVIQQKLREYLDVEIEMECNFQIDMLIKEFKII